MQAHRLKNATGGGGIGSRMKGGLSCNAGAELAIKVIGITTVTVSALAKLSAFSLDESMRVTSPDNN